MTTLLVHVHLWALRKSSGPQPGDVPLGVHCYRDKSSGTGASSTLSLNAVGVSDSRPPPASGGSGALTTSTSDDAWSLARGLTTLPPNGRASGRAHRLRDALRQCEKAMAEPRRRPVAMQETRFGATHGFVLFLNDGTLTLFTVASHSGDCTGMVHDAALADKINDRHIASATLLGGPLALLTSENHSRLTLVQLYKEKDRSDDRLPQIDIKVMQTVQLGPAESAQQAYADARVCANPTGSLVACFWTRSGTSERRSRVNVVLFAVSSSSASATTTGIATTTAAEPLREVCRVKTRRQQILSLAFSQSHPRVFFTCELDEDNRRRVWLCAYELVEGAEECRTDERETMVVETETEVVHAKVNHGETATVLVCDDGALVLVRRCAHNNLGSGAVAAAPALARRHVPDGLQVPLSVLWHESDAALAVVDSRGSFCWFDAALTLLSVSVHDDRPLNVDTSCIDLSMYLDRLGHHTVSAAEPRQQQQQQPQQLRKSFPVCVWARGEPNGSCYRGDTVLVALESGPLCAVRLELGAVDDGTLGFVSLMRMHLRLHRPFSGVHEQQDQMFAEALALARVLPWSVDASAALCALRACVDTFLRLYHDEARVGDGAAQARAGALETLLWRLFATYDRRNEVTAFDQEELEDDEGGSHQGEGQLSQERERVMKPAEVVGAVDVKQQREQITVNVFRRRFFTALVRHERLESALRCARQLSAPDLYAIVLARARTGNTRDGRYDALIALARHARLGDTARRLHLAKLRLGDEEQSGVSMGVLRESQGRLNDALTAYAHEGHTHHVQRLSDLRNALECSLEGTAHSPVSIFDLDAHTTV